jgi:hypothetical protein
VLKGLRLTTLGFRPVTLTGGFADPRLAAGELRGGRRTRSRTRRLHELYESLSTPYCLEDVWPRIDPAAQKLRAPDVAISHPHHRRPVVLSCARTAKSSSLVTITLPSFDARTTCS